MICPRCRGENSEDAVKCYECGLKLKISCPKCKNLNVIGNKNCSSCGLRLISVCPSCKAANSPREKHCRKCGFELLIQCPSCMAVNSSKNLKCLKCEHDLSGIAKKRAEQNSTLKQAPLHLWAVLGAELLNLTSLQAKLSPELLEKLKRNFYNTVAKAAKESGIKAMKINEKLMAIEFKKEDSSTLSCAKAVSAATKIINDINEINYALVKKFNIKLKVKVGISLINGKERNYFAKSERLAARSGEIVVSAGIFDFVKDFFKFAHFAFTNKEQKNVSFFRLSASEPEAEIPVTQNKPAETPEVQPEIIEKETELALEPEEIQIETVEEVPETIPSEVQALLEREVIPEKEPEPQKTEETADIPEDKEIQKEEPSVQTEIEIINANQSETSDLLVELIKQETGSVISIYGQEGIGKSSAVAFAKKEVPDDNCIWLVGLCEPVNRLVPFAYFKDVLKTLFNLPSIIVNLEESHKEVSNILDILGIRDKHSEKVLSLMLFQENLTEDASQIFVNRRFVFEGLTQILRALNSRGKIVILVEDIEYIDSASLDFINFVAKTGFLSAGNNIIITHSAELNTKILPLINLNSESAVKINLTPMNDEEMDEILLKMFNNQEVIPSKYKERLFQAAKGNPLYLEQAVMLLFETGIIYPQDDQLYFKEINGGLGLSENIEDVIRNRVNVIAQTNENSLSIVCLACLLGQKFIPGLIQKIIDLPNEEFSEVMQRLVNFGIFAITDRYNLRFKHKTLWETVYKYAFSEEDKIQNHKMIFEILKNFTRSSGVNIAMHAEIAGLYKESFGYWGLGSIEAISLGDAEAYTECQKRVLSLLEKVEDLGPDVDREKLRSSIYEQLGLINYQSNPYEALRCLSNAIVYKENKKEDARVINLAGFLSKSCELLGNYSGVVECADKALSKIDRSQMPFEAAILKYCKLEALFSLGRFDEVIMLSKIDIIPVIRQFASRNRTVSGLTPDEINYILSDARLIYCSASALKGNKEIFPEIEDLINTATAQGLTSVEARANAVKLFLEIIQGKGQNKTQEIEKINKLALNIAEPEIMHLYAGMLRGFLLLIEGKTEEFALTADALLRLAEICKEFNFQCIIKFLVGKVLFERGETAKARSIYHELLDYCSQSKLAIPMLIGWYLCSKLEIKSGNIEKASEIIEKALEVSKKPEINNSIMSALFLELISDIKLLKGDFEGAGIYLDQALKLAEKDEMLLLKARFNLSYGKIYQEVAVNFEENRKQAVTASFSYFNNSLKLAQEINNQLLKKESAKAVHDLTAFCKLSGIEI